jgi:hypothetical protein
VAITLKEETILNQWNMLVDGAAGRGTEVLTDLERFLRAARVPGECTWELEEVQSAGFFSKVRREFLIVRLLQFSDYRNYVGIRDYGSHLDCCRFLTVEPGFFKREFSKAIGGGEERLLSAPRNVLVEQDLTAWVSVVHHCVVDAVRGLVTKLGRDPSCVRTETKGFLHVW